MFMDKSPYLNDKPKFDQYIRKNDSEMERYSQCEDVKIQNPF